jgi:hypothetical protein
MCGFVQHSSRCSHVSSRIILHRDQLTFVESSLQKRCFLALPIY